MLRESADNQEDLELILAARAGKRASVDEFLRRMRCIPVLLEVCNRRRGKPLDEALLQDVAQDTLVAIWSKLSAYTGVSPLEAWVYRFCVHKHMAAVRNRARRLRIEAVESPLLDGVQLPELVSTLDEELVQLSLQELDERQARIVRLKHFEGLTFQKIAQRMAIPTNTTKTHYYRALDKLREFFLRRREGPG